MATKATKRFWLDGGYDRELVEACLYHPFHKWTTLRLGDVLVEAALHGPDEAEELLTICAACYVPRCGSVADHDRCIWPRHHREPHRFEQTDEQVPIGG